MEGTKLASRSSTISLEAGLRQVFPLFGPIKEKEWADDWDPHILLGEPGRVEEHMVFQTETGDPEDPGLVTWIVSKYDPNQALIEYTVFGQDRIWWICIKCRQGESGAATKATIEYTYFGLNEESARRNQEALDRMFRQDLRDWEAAINHYLSAGTLLRQHHPGHDGRG
ncbi:MAG: hypothetical protein WBR18_10895 [Anaerolineales bacterium]